MVKPPQSSFKGFEPKELLRRRLLLLCLLTAGLLVWFHTTGQEVVDDAISQSTQTPVHSPDYNPEYFHRTVAAKKKRPPMLAMNLDEALMRGTYMPVTQGHVVAKITNEDVEEKLAAMGSKVLWRSPFTGKVRLAVPDGSSPQRFSQDLMDAGLVKEAHPDPVSQGASINDQAPLKALQWHLSALNIGPVWAARPEGFAGQGLVAILDTGVAYEAYEDESGQYDLHPDLEGVQFAQGYDFINLDEHPNDDHSHGTHLATLIAGNGTALGVTPGMGLMPVKVLDANKIGTESALIDGIHYAIAAGVDVINMSLAFPPAYRPGQDMEDAIVAARNAGVTMVAASGNQGLELVAFPAAFPDVIAVGAASQDPDTGRVIPAPYSNHGPALDVLAPGGNIEADANGDGHPDGVLSGTFALGDPLQPGHWFVAGTSVAAAQVSALAAVLHSEGVASRDVRWTLQHTTRAVADHNIGGGFSHHSGKGLVDAQAAVEAARDGIDTDRSSYAVNAVVAMAEHNGQWRTVVLMEAVEVQGQNVSPAAGVRLHFDWVGDVEGSGWCVTNRRGRCKKASGAMDAPAKLFGATIHGVEDAQRNLHRPGSFARFEERSWRLAASLGRGLSGQEMAFAYAPAALEELENIIQYPVRPTITIKATGAGLASSATVLGVDMDHFLQSSLSAHYTVLQSFGTGLASSAIIWDPVFFHPSLAAQTDTLVVVDQLQGMGLASSAIVTGNLWRPVSDYVSVFDPGVMQLSTGAGLASSAIVLDRSLWNPALLSQLSPPVDVLPQGVGLASSAFIFELTPQTLDFMGFDGNLLQTQGMGLASSAFVFNAAADLYSTTTIELTSMALLDTDFESTAQGHGTAQWVQP